VTVDGIVKTAYKIKSEKEVLEELKEKIPVAKEKIKYYLDNTCCHKKELIEALKYQTDITNAYWDKVIKNYESGHGYSFANSTLKTGEIYKYTDDILNTINALLECHFETSKRENYKCQKSLKSFKRICIVSSSVGLTIIVAVILKFFSEKKEIKKRNIEIVSKKTTRPKKIIQNKKQ
jgi:hypothetical protein